MLENQDIRDLPLFLEVKTMANLSHNKIVKYITSWVEQKPEKSAENFDTKSLENFEIDFSDEILAKK